MPSIGQVASGTWTSNQATTLEVALTQPVAVGTTLVALITAQALASQDANWTAADTQSNTWTERAHQFKSGSLQSSLLTMKATTALGTSDTITFTHGAVGVNLQAVTVVGFDDASDFDVKASTDGSGTSVSAGPTAEGAQATELVIGGFGLNGSPQSFTPGDGFTATPLVTAGTRSSVIEYKYATATGTRSASGTTTNGSAWVGIVAALKSGLPSQVAVPVEDITTDGWTNVGGAASFSDALADSKDSTYAQSPDNPTGAKPMVVGLGQLFKPTDMTKHKLTVVAELADGATSGSITVSLLQGSTEIASDTFTLNSNLQPCTLSLTETEANSITDYESLRLKYTTTAS